MELVLLHNYSQESQKCVCYANSRNDLAPIRRPSSRFCANHLSAVLCTFGGTISVAVWDGAKFCRSSLFSLPAWRLHRGRRRWSWIQTRLTSGGASASSRHNPLLACKAAPATAVATTSQSVSQSASGREFDWPVSGAHKAEDLEKLNCPQCEP